MIARLFVNLPHAFALQVGEEYVCKPFECEGYTVRPQLPLRSADAAVLNVPDAATLNESEATVSNVLCLDFLKEEFSREAGGDFDPPKNVIDLAVQSFLRRVRAVAHAHMLSDISLDSFSWTVRYLNDDESEVESRKGLIRGFGAKVFSFGLISLTPQMWLDANEMNPDFKSPPWETLLLDAINIHPHVGAGVTLVATALEVFIADVLERVATADKIDQTLWSWINDRGDWRQEPTVSEQYTDLLQVLVGRSLKEEAALWETFRHIRKARNSFVHEGTAVAGGKEVVWSDVATYVRDARKITKLIREWLPEAAQWPVYEYLVKTGMTKLLMKIDKGDEKPSEEEDA